MPETFDQSLLAALDALPLEENAAPLTDAEYDRVLARALVAVGHLRAASGAVQREKGRKTMRRMLVSAAAAACLFLGCVDLASPAFAERLPVVGGLFAWLNSHTGGTLASEQLDQYATDADLAADTADGAEEALRLCQIWRDEAWMRLSVELTDTDGSLADYNAIAFYDESLQTSHAGNGDLTFTLDGREGLLMQEGDALYLTRVDETTFAAELRYRLSPEDELLVGVPMQLALNDLRGCVLETPTQTETGALYTGSGPETPLPGSYTVTFAFPKVSTGGRRTAADTAVQNGLSVPQVTATPAYTYIEVMAAHDSLFGGDHNSQETDDVGASPCFVLTGPNGEEYRFERWEGGLVLEHDASSDTLYRGYCDAIPEDVDAVTLAVYRIGEHARPTGEALASFTLTLR